MLSIYHSLYCIGIIPLYFPLFPFQHLSASLSIHTPSFTYHPPSCNVNPSTSLPDLKSIAKFKQRPCNNTPWNLPYIDMARFHRHAKITRIAYVNNHATASMKQTCPIPNNSLLEYNSKYHMRLPCKSDMVKSCKC